MVTRLAFVALLAFVSLLNAEKTLNYNVGGGPLGKFCGDPAAFLVDKQSSFPFENAPKVGPLGALASHRATTKGSTGFSFVFPVPPGSYNVVLGFAEVYAPNFKKGARVFSYSVQGKGTSGFDVFNGVGGDKPLWRTVKAAVVGAAGLKISLAKGPVENPMISVIEITRADGKELTYPAGSSCGTGVSKPSGPPVKPPPAPVAPPKCGVNIVADKSKLQDGQDHQAHAVAGEGYVATDFDGNGKVTVVLDGSKSHSHYFDPVTKISGTIVSYTWTAFGKVISKKEMFNYEFPVGKTVVTLTVKDNLGDVACENTEVIGLPASNTGAYCYFYPGLTNVFQALNTDPKPSQGVKVESINWPTSSAFPFLGKSGKMWTVRCIANLKAGALAPGAVSIQRNGRVHVYVGAKTLVDEKPGQGGKGVVKVNSAFPAGTTALNIVYNKIGGDGQFVLQLNGVAVKQSQLMFSQSGIIPVLKSIFPEESPKSGGGQLQLFGNGFFNGPYVVVGKAQAQTKVVSASELLISIPSSAAAGSMKPKVWVGNKAGESNNILLNYVSGPTGCKNTVIKWKQTFLKKKDGSKFFIPLIASIAMGPDFNYYMGSQDGFLHKVSAGKQLTVNTQCKSFSMGQARSVLGVGFNPKKKFAQPYITTSTLFRKSSKVNTPLKNKVDGWANGKVEMLTLGCGCFCKPTKTIVSGLPVSHHDHAVNKITFLKNGDMLLTVAGSTNGGHNTPGNLLGGLAETPFAASILLIKTSKGDNIKGAIKYTNYANPAAAKVVAPGQLDIEIYATGLRNSFGLCRTVKNQIYATDNGANKGFGLKSTGCNSQVAFQSNVPDELNLIKKGSHYGHANRNQNKCVWGTGTKPVTTFQSSTDGIMQYNSNAFCGTLKYDIIATQYTTQNPAFQGNTNRVILNPNGSVKSKLVMVPYSGVAVENGLHGEIVMPRVGKFMVAVLQPDYKPPAGLPFVVSVTPKLVSGNQQILVGGNNFKTGLKALVGGKPCGKVIQVTDTSFKCTTPPGSGVVAVTVINPGGATSPKIAPAGDVEYL